MKRHQLACTVLLVLLHLEPNRTRTGGTKESSSHGLLHTSQLKQNDGTGYSRTAIGIGKEPSFYSLFLQNLCVVTHNDPPE